MQNAVHDPYQPLLLILNMIVRQYNKRDEQVSLLFK